MAEGFVQPESGSLSPTRYPTPSKPQPNAMGSCCFVWLHPVAVDSCDDRGKAVSSALDQSPVESQGFRFRNSGLIKAGLWVEGHVSGLIQPSCSHYSHAGIDSDSVTRKILVQQQKPKPKLKSCQFEHQ